MVDDASLREPMYISLRRVRSFVAVARFGGFRRAAEELALSQPALSSHINEIESYLGVQLFQRTTRQVRLTAEGELFLRHAERAIAELKGVEAELRTRAAIQRGRVIVAVVPSIGARVLPGMLADFMSEHPAIEVQIYDDRAEVIESHVKRSEVDFAIGPNFSHASDLEFEHVVDDPFFAIFPTTHPLAEESVVTLHQLLRHPLIAMRSGLSMRQTLDAAAASIGERFDPKHVIYHHDTLIGLVQAGYGVGALPALALPPIRAPHLSTAIIVDPPVVRAIGLITRRDKALTPVAEHFADSMRQYLRSLSESTDSFRTDLQSVIQGQLTRRFD